MDNKSVRRENIKLLVQKAGGPTEFGKLIDREQVQVSQWVGGKNIGDRLARHIESRLRVPEGTLDHLLPQTVVLAQNMLVISREQNALLAREPSPAYPEVASQSGGLDADKVEDTITALLTVLRRRDPTATLSFEDRIDIETFCEAYALLDELEDQRQGREAGAVIADLVAKREEKRNAREREQGGAGQSSGGADRGKAGRKVAGA